jgi:mannose-1-phosphate guanylyltransferase
MLPKQLLPVVGQHSLIRQTAERLKKLVPAERLWVLTSETLRKKVIQELPEVPRRQVIAEPVQRNTGPAIGLAARLLQERDPDAVMGVLEKPPLPRAKRFVKAGNYFWNAGMFVWRARVIGNAIEELMPQTSEALSRLAPLSSRRFTGSLRAYYGDCDNESIDYGVLEQAKNIVGFACPEFGWNDVGSWEAVYQLLRKPHQGSVSRTAVHQIDSQGNYVEAPGKLAALVGVKDLIVVDTPDALLICSREHAQRVSTLVKELETADRDDLL